jgi:hypothetical protein
MFFKQIKNAFSFFNLHIIIDSLVFHAEQETIRAEQIALHNNFGCTFIFIIFATLQKNQQLRKMRHQTHQRRHQCGMAVTEARWRRTARWQRGLGSGARAAEVQRRQIGGGAAATAEQWRRTAQRRQKVGGSAAAATVAEAWQGQHRQ